MASTLLDARIGERVTLDVPAAEAALRLRLAEMGLRCGQCVCPLQRTPGGGRVIEVGTTRVALDRATCRLLALMDAAAPGSARAASPVVLAPSPAPAAPAV